MKIEFSKLVSCMFILSLLSAPTWSAWADDENENMQPNSFACAASSNVMDCIEKTKQTTPTALPRSANTQQLGYQGPVSLGVRYDTDLGWIPELTYTQLFYNNAAFFQLNYGANEHRANITLGHAFSPNQQIKLTYEYLAQNLGFDFESGSVNEWVSQSAFGAAYRYLLTHQIVRSVDLAGYYIRANNKNLADVVFYQNNDPSLNQRRIAGGTEETVTTGVTLSPSRQLLINLGAGYSHLAYDTIYEDARNTTTIAYNAGIDFLATSHMKLSAGITHSAAETNNRVKLSRILPAHIEAAITGQHSQGQAGQPNSTSLMLSFAYPVVNYTAPADGRLGALKDWVQKPVVHAARVLAIKDERVIKFNIGSTNPPTQALLTGQMMQPLSTQSIFNFDPILYDKVVYSLSLAPNSNDLTDPQSQLNITVQPVNDYTANIYSTAPLPNSATPDGKPVTYHVIITALGYKSGLATPIQSQADLELDVNFNKDNEPQWIDTKGTINFDMTDPAGAINLNQLITQNDKTSEVKFYFNDPSKYPNWDIITSSGTWYLVRKPDANGAFDAGDISSTAPQKITISAQYSNDPEGITVPGQVLDIMVNPDDKITFDWSSDSACQVTMDTAYYPADSSKYSQLSLPKCTIYKNGSGNVLKVKNDTITYPQVTSTGDYPGNLSVSGTTLTIGNPQSGLGNSYNISLSVQSKAQGGSSAALNANNLIHIGNDLVISSNGNPNVYQFPVEGTPSYTTSFIVNDLDDSSKYAVTATSSTAKMMAAPCTITDNTSYVNCQNKQSISLGQPLPNSINGTVSIMWYNDVAPAPTVEHFTIHRLS